MTATRKPLKEIKVNVRLKIAAVWTAVMFLFIYVDHFALFIPGVLDDVTAGTVGGFEISHIVVGAVYTAVVVGNLIGETWAFSIVGSAVEIGLLALIVGLAWAWPRET